MKQHGIHDVKVTDNTSATRWNDGDEEYIYELYCLMNYMMEENLFAYVECSSVKHATSRFSVRKNVKKKSKRKEKKE